MKTTGLLLAAVFILSSTTSMAAEYNKKNKSYKSSTSNSQNINNRPTRTSDAFARDDVSGMPVNPRIQPRTNTIDQEDFGRRAMEGDELGGSGTLRR
ncbi:hypothetical protein [Bdellovibrio sp. HCB209]|uniref:hypothetical protein n=1 Tax=Bdellovibrio sp. HCB209 TaxID=3394354 RepID=UPI0039B374D7